MTPIHFQGTFAFQLPISFQVPLAARASATTASTASIGTQGRCTATGVWEPRQIEQPEKLDERRAAVGLGPEADYIAVFNCTGAPRG
jgi:hypothetical protein